MNKKLLSTILGAVSAACFVTAGVCFARSQYYQGRIDAREELMSKIINLKDRLEKMNYGKKEEKA